MFFSLGSIAGAGLAALSTFKRTLMSGSQQGSINFHISPPQNFENVTIVSPQPLEVIGPQFTFKFVDTAYNRVSTNVVPDSLPPLDVTLRNKTYEGALFPSKIHFIPDSDPPTAEVTLFVFTHPAFAEGPYNLSINEWVIEDPFDLHSMTTLSHFDVPVIFSYDAKGDAKEKPAHEEL